MDKISVWKNVDDKTTIYDFADSYIDFLNANKTEREVVNASIQMLKGKGDFFVRNIRKKALVVAKPSKDILSTGMRIIAAHIDVPRIDLKPTPLYEEQDLVLLKTHYYGGIRKYQWLSIPLSIHGVVVTKDEKVKEIVIGEDEGEPVFTIPDLLPHLSREQQEKKIKEFAKGEELNVLFGSYPKEKKKEKGKENPVLKNILDLLESRYGIEEEDLISAELELVPAWKARNVGLDESLIGGYGHDDRICAYSALKALLSVEKMKKVPTVILFDKEEIGSEGNTGANSQIVTDFIMELLESLGIDPTYRNIRYVIEKSSVISADVTAGLHPTYPEVLDKYNAAKIGYGIVLTKYTGHGGKGGSSDAHAEFVGEVRGIYNKADVRWQTGELGKVDLGGGGTVAKFLAQLGLQVIDSGPPLLAMHSPFEIVSKGDLFHTYKGYKAFLEG
ncbi:aminopeptidase [candidate division WOR-3 bacterium]|nr:aminopeptidase [candidate division WOR-3 bacterium]MCK4527646.1 aminopeptidase [candidate division WOR-3 bacterium]